MRGIYAVGAAAALALGRRASAHPLCYYGDRPTDPEASLTFCPAQNEFGACCTPDEELAAVAVYQAASNTPLQGDCADLYKEVNRHGSDWE